MLTRTVLATVAAALLAATPALAEGKKLTPSKTWNGSIDDEALQKEAPANSIITDAKSFEKLWKAWKIDGKTPEVDFTKDLVAITMSRGSRINLICELDDKGELRVGGFGTRDLRPGFRYVLGVVSRDGVKTVGGKELPAGK